MAEEKILKDEILSEEQLKQVAGGTYQEYREIEDAILANPALSSDYSEYWHLYEGGNNEDFCEFFLLRKFGIDIRIDDLKANVYYAENDWCIPAINRKTLTHAEVINMINNYKG
ncbi:MAG: hypothetical protein IJK81_02125 [Selenomonadaceae bacterium]|nr:hypothetical protein [Selenomonadaceae bacterium]